MVAIDWLANTAIKDIKRKDSPMTEMVERVKGSVTVETAKVYRGARRRYFTLASAERSFALAAVRARCECEPPDHDPRGYPGWTCSYHAMDATRFNRLIHLYTVMFVRPASRAALKEDQTCE